MNDTKEIVLSPITPMMLIERASASGASIEQMQQLFELKLRVEADEARKAFNQAFNGFKAEAIEVVKNTVVKDGPLKGKRYVDLFGVVRAVTPSLAKHGLSHSWKLTKDDSAWMEVTCALRHVQGHSEIVSMGSAPDVGPERNAIQARASAISYLERYTLLAITGLASGEMDDDGNGGSQRKMADQDFLAYRDNIEAALTHDDLKKFFNAAYIAAEKMKDKGSMADFIRSKDNRKGEL
jgi:hypothetical protein